MGRRGWVLGGIAAALIVAIGGGAVAATTLPGKVERLAKDQIAATVDADVTWGAVALDAGAFPRLGLTVKDVVVAGRGPFAGVELARIDRAAVAVDLFSALSSSVRVRRVALTGAKLDLQVDRKGRANWDIVKDTGAETEASSFALHLDDLVLTDATVDYRDRSSRMSAHAGDLDLRGDAAWAGSVANVAAKLSIGDVDFRSGRTKMLADTKWTSDFDVAYDTATGGITVTRSGTTVNDFPLDLQGTLVPEGAGWVTDLTFRTPVTEFGPLLSLVPNAYAGSMDKVESSGTFTFSGMAKGKYEGDLWPGLDFKLDVKDGAFAYPGLPSEVKKLALKARVLHQPGPSANTDLDLQRFHLEAGGGTFDASGTVNRMFGDPVVDLTGKGRVDLGALGGALPTPEGTEIPKGVIDLDVAIAGSRSDFEVPRPNKVKARGTVAARGVRIVTDAFPEPVTIQALDLTLTPQSVDLAKFDLLLGASDLAMTGGFDNLLGYALGGDTLTGGLTLSSKKFDLRPLQGRDTEEGTSDESGLLVAVPADLDLRVDATFGKVITRRLEVTDVSGTLTVADGAVRMEGLKGSTLGGEATISGSYVAPTAEQADLDVSIDTVSFDIGRTFGAFDTLKKVAPILEKVSGQFDSGFSLKTRLAKDGTPELSVTRSAGRVAPTGQAKVQSMAGSEKSLGPSAGGGGGSGFGAVQLGGDALQYLLQEGMLNLSPWKVKLGGMAATLQGTSSVADKVVDLTFTAELPLGALGDLAKGVKKGGSQPIVVRLKGPWADPKVTVRLAGDDPIDAAKNLASDALKAQADAILDEAKRAADGLVAEAESKAKRIEKDADNPAEKLAAKAVADTIRSKARKAADKLLDEARKKADTLLSGGGGKKDGGKGGGKGKKGR